MASAPEQDEVLGSPLRPLTLPGALDQREPSVQFEGMHSAVSEIDFFAYGKSDPTVQMERNVMKRMFSAFDVRRQGVLDKPEIDQLLAYLCGQDETRSNPSCQRLCGCSALSFDAFWEWWSDYDKAEKAFQTVSGDFAANFHQLQLLSAETGEKFTPAYRLHYQFKDLETGEVHPASPWHDIPLYVRDVVRTTPESVQVNKYNFICEIPKWTRAKFEISTTERFNPIKQDMKNGLPRFYQHGDMMWNYGAFPQTWESTELTFVDGVKGDNDPVDGIEIGMVQLKTGEVSQVKVLGVLGMIDNDEMDWKIICISHKDPVAKFLKDITDVPKVLPGCLNAIREWLRAYKICQGGSENRFAYNGEYKDRGFAMHVLEESHRMWANLKKIKKKEQV